MLVSQIKDENSKGRRLSSDIKSRIARGHRGRGGAIRHRFTTIHALEHRKLHFILEEDKHSNKVVVDCPIFHYHNLLSTHFWAKADSWLALRCLVHFGHRL